MSGAPGIRLYLCAFDAGGHVVPPVPGGGQATTTWGSRIAAQLPEEQYWAVYSQQVPGVAPLETLACAVPEVALVFHVSGAVPWNWTLDPCGKFQVIVPVGATQIGSTLTVVTFTPLMEAWLTVTVTLIEPTVQL
jgi:hypothetical protein